jgi:hypothetical protein
MRLEMIFSCSLSYLKAHATAWDDDVERRPDAVSEMIFRDRQANVRRNRRFCITIDPVDWFPRIFEGRPDVGDVVQALPRIPDIKPNNPVAFHPEYMRHGLVLQAMVLPFERLTIELEDGLDHLDGDGAILRFFKRDRLDVWADDGPLACPVVAHGLTTMDVTVIHAVGPGDIVGED